MVPPSPRQTGYIPMIEHAFYFVHPDVRACADRLRRRRGYTPDGRAGAAEVELRSTGRTCGMARIAMEPLTHADRAWAAAFLAAQWGATTMVVHGVAYEPYTLPGFVATYAGQRVGLVTYRIDESGCEIVSLDSTLPGRGVGT